MLVNRVMPCLLLMETGLYKTHQFKKPSYVGDPVNAVKIFNDKEVDELIFLDISDDREARGPNFSLISDIASECFMPLVYGGGVSTMEHARKLFQIGVEKVAINTAAYSGKGLISEIADVYGSQAVIASIDFKKNVWGKPVVYSHSGKKSARKNPVEAAQYMEQEGAGEILLTSIDREGSWNGFDLEMINKVSQAVTIPVIANGGAGSLDHIAQAVKNGASAVSVGSMAVYQKKGMGVLINFPSPEAIQTSLSS